MCTLFFLLCIMKLFFWNFNSLGMYCVSKYRHIYVLDSAIGSSQRQFKSTSAARTMQCLCIPEALRTWKKITVLIQLFQYQGYYLKLGNSWLNYKLIAKHPSICISWQNTDRSEFRVSAGLTVNHVFKIHKRTIVRKLLHPT